VRLALAIVALTGCRLYFEPVTVDDATISGDVNADGPVELCARPTTLLCDDFTTLTSPLFGTAQWLSSSGRSGGGLRITADAATSGSSVFPFPTLTSGSLYARVYAFVQPGPPIVAFNVLLEVNNAVTTGGIEKVSGDMFTGDVWSIGAPYSGGGPKSTTSVTRGTWVCIELGVDIDATAGATRLSIDGTEVVSATMLDTLIPSGFKQALLTANVDTTDPSITVLFDDLVVALVPIGC
jgi:hypothetical protein